MFTNQQLRAIARGVRKGGYAGTTEVRDVRGHALHIRTYGGNGDVYMHLVIGGNLYTTYLGYNRHNGSHNRGGPYCFDECVADVASLYKRHEIATKKRK